MCKNNYVNNKCSKWVWTSSIW